jgi:hypothetical protein
MPKTYRKPHVTPGREEGKRKREGGKGASLLRSTGPVVMHLAEMARVAERE